jgi:hypothetical protein
LGSLLQHGTLEFRHAPTFPEVGGMHNWLQVVDQLVRTSLEFKYPSDALSLAETEPGEFLSIVLRGYDPASLPDYMDRMVECDTVGVLRRALVGKPSYKPKGDYDGPWEFGNLEPMETPPAPEELDEEPEPPAPTFHTRGRNITMRRLEAMWTAAEGPVENEFPFDEE